MGFFTSLFWVAGVWLEWIGGGEGLTWWVWGGRLTLYQRRAGGAKKNAGAGAGVGGVEGGVGAVVGMAVVGLLVL